VSDLGVAVVGTGGVAALHLAAVGRLQGVRLVGVCDVDAGRARTAAAGAGDGVRWTTDLDACLAWPDVEGVIVCTPNDTHREVGLRVLEAGRHLLIEKPIAIDLRSADALIDAAERHRLVLMPGQTQRFYEPGRALRAAIDRGDVGRPTFARSTLVAGWIWGGWGAWVLDPTRSGGHILHNGIHGIDLVTWWIGDEPVEAFARGYRGTSPALGIDDHFSVVLRFRGGAQAVVEVSRAARPRSIVIRESVVAGADGIVRITPASGGGIVANEAGSVGLGFDAQVGFDREVAAWVAAARDGAALPVTAQDGRLALAASLAAERSARTGRPVRVAGR
jgi:predicted dehydrogenase